jgi:hypothetical protein
MELLRVEVGVDYVFWTGRGAYGHVNLRAVEWGVAKTADHCPRHPHRQ